MKLLKIIFIGLSFVAVSLIMLLVVAKSFIPTRKIEPEIQAFLKSYRQNIRPTFEPDQTYNELQAASDRTRKFKNRLTVSYCKKADKNNHRIDQDKIYNY